MAEQKEVIAEFDSDLWSGLMDFKASEITGGKYEIEKIYKSGFCYYM